MKQVIESIKDGTITIVDVPTPAPVKGRVLVDTEASVISSGTERAVVEFGKKNLVQKALARPDLVRAVIDKSRKEGLRSAVQSARSRLDDWFPLGYSSAGIVVGGEGPFEAGCRVACTGSGFAMHAEVASVPVNLCARVPEGVSSEEAAFAGIASVALHGIHRVGAQPGERVAIIGLGLLGRLGAQMAHAYGMQVWGVDASEAALKVVRAEDGIECASATHAPKAAAAFTNGRLFDRVLVFAASQDAGPLETATAIAAPGATICVIGDVPLHASRRDFYEKELNLVVSRSYGFGRHHESYEEDGVDYPPELVRWPIGRNLEEVLRLMQTGGLQPSRLVGHTASIDEAVDAYQKVLEGAFPGRAVVLTYPQSGDSAARKIVHAPAKAGPTSTEPRISLIGAGNFARATILPAMTKTPGWTPATVVSAGGLSSTRLGKQYKFQASSTNVDDALEGDTDAVVITTRHDLHAQQALAALRAGKHAFVEKPLALSVEDLESIVHEARQRGVAIATGFNRRWSPALVAAKEALTLALGPSSIAIDVHAGSLPAGHWLTDEKTGGGRLLGEGCHFVDLANHLVGTPALEAHAWAIDDPLGNGGFHISLRYKDGSMATIRYLPFGAVAEPKEVIRGTRGDTSILLNDHRRLRVRKGRKETNHRFSGDKGHMRNFQHFLDLVAHPEGRAKEIDTIAASLYATFAALQSIRLHQPVQIGGTQE